MALQHASYGSYIIKCNQSTDGRRQKYFQLTLDRLSWASKKHFVKTKKNSSLLLSDVVGVTYGKISTTFCKIYNKSLEPHLCVSLVLGNRTLDLYFGQSQSQLNHWVIALSYCVKQKNPSAYGLTVGQFYWRKLVYLLDFHLNKAELKEMYPLTYHTNLIDNLKQKF